MNILEIYEKYQIMPQLAEHQFRVAAVADLICENIREDVGRSDVVKACLLHDMGNIIKFDFGKTKNMLNQDIDLEYWQKVQDKYKRKYGNDEHLAHVAIAKELGASGRVITLIEAISFLGAPDNAASGDFGKKICQYSDDRVGPFGVISLDGRFADLRKRYDHHRESTAPRDNFERALRDIESQIFSRCQIGPQDINDKTIKPQIEALKKIDIG